MKKLAIVMNNLGGGGAERVGCTLAEFFAQSGHDVFIVKLFDSANDYSPAGINGIHSLPNVKNKYVKTLLRIIDLGYFLIKNKIDTVIVMGVGDLAIFAVNRILKNVKFILSERNDPGSQYSVDIVLGKRVNNFLMAADAVVFQTPDAMAYFNEEVQRKGTVIPNPIKDGLPSIYEGNRKKEIVNFCRLNVQKNLPLLIDAFTILHKDYPEYKLTIYGRGELRDDLLKYISKCNMESFIAIKDFSQNIHAEVKDASMFVSSSDFEGISNSMLEAMAIGLPTVCTDCPAGGARMMIEDQKNGLLVPVRNADALYSAMKKIIDNPDFAKKLSYEAIKLRDTLAKDIICKEWEKLI